MCCPGLRNIIIAKGIIENEKYVIHKTIPPYSRERICEDNDGDGHCNWGLDAKPSTGCPPCDSIPDCDDSDGSIFTECGFGEPKKGNLKLTVKIPPESGLHDCAFKVYVQPFTELTYDYGKVSAGDTILINNLDVGRRRLILTPINCRGIKKRVDVVIKDGETTEMDIIPTLYFIEIPHYRGLVGGKIEIRGYVLTEGFERYEIEWSEENSGTWHKNGIVLENNGLTSVLDGKLGEWDTQNLPRKGKYKLRLTVYYKDYQSSHEDSLQYVSEVYYEPNIKKII